jgi:hypothetical protein
LKKEMGKGVNDGRWHSHDGKDDKKPKGLHDKTIISVRSINVYKDLIVDDEREVSEHSWGNHGSATLFKVVKEHNPTPIEIWYNPHTGVAFNSRTSGSMLMREVVWEDDEE